VLYIESRLVHFTNGTFPLPVSDFSTCLYEDPNYSVSICLLSYIKKDSTVDVIGILL